MEFYYLQYLAALLHLHFFQTEKLILNVCNNDNLVLVSALMKKGNFIINKLKLKNNGFNNIVPKSLVSI